MIRTLFFVLIAAATLSVFASTSLPQKVPSIMIQSTLGRGSSGFASVRRACFASHNIPYGIRPFESRSTTCDSEGRLRLRALNPIPCRSANFHSSTILMMGGKRKKNGGKSKQVKVVSISKTAAKKLASESTLEESRQVDSEEYTLAELFDNDIETGDDEETGLASTEFASEYHAPVMPTECVQALLQQGMWAELLEAKKNRWRKKRSIIDAKKRRLGHLDDNDTDDSDSKEIDAHELSHDISENTRPRLFIDGTLGGGGHSQAILEQLSPGDILIGCDVDPEALSTASNRLINYLGTREYILDRHDDGMECRWDENSPMFIPVQSNFRNLISVLSKVRHPKTKRLLLGDRENRKQHDLTGEIEFPLGANGMLLDLGVSSHQIDTPDRGFAFMKDGPLDMRMSGNSLISSRATSSSLTAADICNEFDEPSIISILQTFGDEPRARRIASAIVAARPLYSTTDLVHAINSVTPTFARQKRAGLIATSARVFQALRIAVNEEDGALRDVLEKVAPWVLCRSGGMMKTGDIDGGSEGMLVVLSYHSMEDKMTKRVMRDGSVNFLDRHRGRGGALERDIFGNTIGQNGDSPFNEEGNQLPFEPLGKPQKATEEEIALNSRARSATLRVGIRN